MNPQGELKLLFAGPMGAGKTTAIAAISDRAPVATEAVNSDRAQHSKSHTTVAFDYGEVRLDDGTCLRLYGMPGQERFDFMWRIAADGALGVILLADDTRPDPLADLATYVDAFAELAGRSAMVVGVGRSRPGRNRVDDYAAWFAQRRLSVPVFSVDVRRKADVLLLLDALLNQIETHDLLAAAGSAGA